MRVTDKLQSLGGVIALFSLLTQSAMTQETSLDATLEKASQRMSGFLDQVSDVKCAEHVVQQKFNKGGHVVDSATTNYDYLVILQTDGDELMLNESRLAEKNAKQKLGIPLLITNGFSTLFLIFHPYYRSSFQFTSEGSEVVDGQTLQRVHFAHIQGRRTPAALSVRGREYPLDFVGTAWIDPQSGTIARIETALQSDMLDVGLRSLTAQVEYTAVDLPGWKDHYRFPASATIDVQTLRQHWRNTHTFTGYMRFSVEAEQASSSKVVQK